MFDFLLSTATLSVSEKLSVGGQVTLLGMGMVFAVLALLWGLVELLHAILGQKEHKKVKMPSEIISAPVVNEQNNNTLPVTEPVTDSTPKDDLAIIAVITAAIAAASGQSPSSFRVVSFKRANNKFSFRK